VVAPRVLASALLVLALASPLASQSSETAALVGRVEALNGEGIVAATVVATGANLIGRRRTAETNGRGAYRISDLAAGIYEIHVSAPGFQHSVRRGIRLAVGATVVVDLTLHLTPVAETVEAIGTLPRVDTTTAAIPLRLEIELLDRLPTSRVFGSLMNLLPGIDGDIGLGGVQQSNAVFIEGINLVDGERSGVWSSINPNWIDGLQVVGAGAGAQYGDFSGIALRGALKSGSDLFSGTGEYRTTRPRWVSINTKALPDAARPNFDSQSEKILDWHDLDGQVGGPLRRNRAWFFGGAQRLHHESKPALYAGPAWVTDDDLRLLAKITTAPRETTRVDGFYQTDRERTTNAGLGPFTPPETTTTDTQPNHDWQLAFRSARARVSFEISTGGSFGTLKFDPPAPGSRSGPYPHYDITTGMSSVNAFNYYEMSSRRVTNTAALMTHFEKGGPHAFSAGIEDDRVTVASEFGIPGGRGYYDDAGVPVEVDLQDPDRTKASVYRSTFYAHDKWILARGITIEPGLRVGLSRGLVSQGRVVTMKTAAPRIGVAWDVLAGHSTVARAHFGRYHDALLTANFGFADAGDRPPHITAAVIGPDQFQEISRTVPSRNELDPRLAAPYFDQWTLGFEHAMTQRLQIGSQFIRRSFDRMMAFIDTGSVYVPMTLPDPGPDGLRGTGDDGASVEVFRRTGSQRFYFTNPAGAYRRYTALQFVARYTDGAAWHLQASYARSSTHGNVENASRTNSGGPELWTNGVFANPNRAINNDGPSSFDYTNEVKVLGSASPRWMGLALSGVYRYHTGIAWGRSAQFPEIGTVIFGVRMEKRGTRRTPPFSVLDLRLEKTIRLSHLRSLGVYVDAFNALNRGTPDPTRRRAVIEVSGPSFGVPQFWLDPRTVRLGVRATF
jgi:hypothetical protein